MVCLVSFTPHQFHCKKYFYFGCKVYEHCHNSLLTLSFIVRFNLMDHLRRTFLYLVQFLVGYFLMLVAMTYNVWLFLAVVIGCGIGYFLATPFMECYFDRKRKAASQTLDSYGRVSSFADPGALWRKMINWKGQSTVYWLVQEVSTWNSLIIDNGNKTTEWSPTQSVIIQVINKIRQLEMGVWFVNHKYDYRQNWSCQLIKTMKKIEKESKHHLYIFLKKKKT